MSSYGHNFTVSREQLVAEQARRWLGVAGPRLVSIRAAEVARATVMLRRADILPLFPPPPPVRTLDARWTIFTRQWRLYEWSPSDYFR